MLVGLAGGCGHTSSTSVTAPAPASPHVIAVAPAARSTRADYAGRIWAQFDIALDPTSVTTKNVYLKLDTVRLPITVAWDSTARRIEIQPVNPLALFTTYTVELSPNLRAADGTVLGVDYLWQFTTTSVRHPVPVNPADRAWDSPFTPLVWAGNETTPGSLQYELYVGTDSTQVATRAVPYLQRLAGTTFVPAHRWTEHSPNFWSVTVVNVTTGERSDGATWRFDTPYADAPIDSLAVQANDWGYQKLVGGLFGSPADCLNSTITSGSNYVSYCQWTFGAVDGAIKLADLHWDLSAVQGWQDSLAGGMWPAASTAIITCGTSILRREDTSRGRLASGWLVAPRTMRFDSDTLTIFVQNLLRRGGLYGFYLHTGKITKLVSPEGTDLPYLPVFEITYYTGPGTPPAPRTTPARPAGLGLARRPGPAALAPGPARNRTAGARRFRLDPGRGSPFNSR